MTDVVLILFKQPVASVNVPQTGGSCAGHLLFDKIVLNHHICGIK